MRPSTNDPGDNAARGRLSNWSFGIGAAAFLTMFFNPLSLAGAAAMIPGMKAMRTHAPHRGRAVLGMVLGVLATVLVVGYLIAGGE